MKRMFANLIGLGLTWGAWLWLVNHYFSPLVSLAIAIIGAIAVIPMVFCGRWLLDRQPTLQRAEWVTMGIHYSLAIFLGSAILEATRFALSTLIEVSDEISTWPGAVLAWSGLSLMLVSGLLFLLVVFNLIVKGLGLPFAAALTRVLVTDWLYAWTRNPMILSALAFLVGLGIWMRSGLFLVWVLVVVSPVVLVSMKVYEERELEIRFGRTYLDYKDSTPFLFPRPPGKS